MDKDFIQAIENFLGRLEVWLKMYLNIIFFGLCLVGSFFVESVYSSKVGILLFTALLMNEVTNLRNDKG